MLLTTPSYPAPPGAIALVIGAALALLGNSMVMVARWSIYDPGDRRVWMTKWGVRISFTGSVAAVWGAASAIIGTGEYPVVGGVLFLVSLAMGALLLAPIFLSGPSSVEEEETEQRPSDEPHGNEGAAVPIERASDTAKADEGRDGHVEDPDHSGVKHRQPTEVHPEASEP